MARPDFIKCWLLRVYNKMQFNSLFSCGYLKTALVCIYDTEKPTRSKIHYQEEPPCICLQESTQGLLEHQATRAS